MNHNSRILCLQVVRGILASTIAVSMVPRCLADVGAEKPGEGIVSTEGNELKLASQDMAWWRDAKFGLFIHWGLYAIPATGEWTMFRRKVPAGEYAKLAGEFIPKHFDAKAWAQAAKNAGMNYMVFTARHHDGFALWNSPSSYQDFCSAKSAAKRDFVAEYVKACRDAGLAVGLYYSPMDWRFPGYFKPKELPENAALMKQQCYGQIDELMKRYGKIDVLWYDGGWLDHAGTDADAAWFWEPVKLNTLVRHDQPKVVISPRSGWQGDFQVQEGGQAVTGPIIDSPWEKCLNLNKGSWGFNKVQNLMKPQEIVNYLVDTVGRGGNMLLNVGPDRDGVIPSSHVAVLKQVGDWLANYGKSIYGTQAGPFQPKDGIYSTTHKANTVYVHVKATREESAIVVLPPIDRRILSSSVLSGGNLTCLQSASQIELTIKNQPANGFPAVVELVLNDSREGIVKQAKEP